MKPGMTINDIPHMTGCIIDMDDGSSMAEFTYPAHRAAFYDEDEKWKEALAKMTASNNAEKLLLSCEEMMTYFAEQPVILKTTRIDFGEDHTNQLLSAGLPNGALNCMSIPFVYQKKIQTGKTEFKTYKMSEMNVVRRPAIASSDRPIKGSEKAAKADQDMDNMLRMLSEM